MVGHGQSHGRQPISCMFTNASFVLRCPCFLAPQKLSTLKTKFEMQAKQNREAYNRLVVRAAPAVQCLLCNASCCVAWKADTCGREPQV